MIRILAAVAAGLAAISVTAGAATAQDAPSMLYHVTQGTFGCVAPDATRALTDPATAPQPDTPEFKTAFDVGHCVTITPRSPWKFVSRDGDVALMSYAGTVGAAGSFYMKIDLLVDPLGNHPNGEPDAPPAAAPTQPVPAAPAPDRSSATALAPQPDAGATDAAPAPRSRAGWLGFILVLAALAGGGLLAWRLYLGRRNTAYNLRLPAAVLADARRLAEANGASLDQFLTTVIAERIRELKAARG
jgi:hypothetical protein